MPIEANEAAVQQAARRLAAPILRKGYQPVGLHAYRDENGLPLFWRVRCKDPRTGEKWIRPMHLAGDIFTLGEPPVPAEGKPLYNLPEIARAGADAIIFVVEGEACADALLALGLVATTSGGADSCGSADWRPLQDRRCIVWPDNDSAGAGYGSAVAATLLGLGCEVLQVDVRALHLPIKGDCCDWIKSNPAADPAMVLSLPTVAAVEPEIVPLVDLRCAADITCLPIRWLWPGWLAQGKLHILAGAPGTGKTTIALAISAAISSGGTWPDHRHAPRGNVLIWSGEDDPADTLVPRLRAAGADLNRVYFVGDVADGQDKRPFDPSTDVQLLEFEAQRIGNIVLIVADPVVSAVAGDSHRNNDVRRALQPLVNLATRLDAAVLGISHFSKASAGRDPVERVTGSIAFGALARVVMVTAIGNVEDGPVRLLARAKSNIGPDGGGFKYGMEQVDAGGMEASRVVWGAAIDGSARELLDQAESENGADVSARDEAAEWLADELAAGPRPAKSLQAEAAKAGIAWRTIERAKAGLGIRSEKCGIDGAWRWCLPKPGKDRQGRHEIRSADVGGLGGIGALQPTSTPESARINGFSLHPHVQPIGIEAKTQ